MVAVHDGDSGVPRFAEYFVVIGVAQAAALELATSMLAAARPASPAPPSPPRPTHPSDPSGDAEAVACDDDFTVCTPPQAIEADDDEPVTPQLLLRTPEVDHPDFELPGNIELFCQPTGCRFSKSRRSPTYYGAVLTALDASRIYVGCLTFDEAIAVPNTGLTVYVPKTICLVSRFAFFNEFRAYLCAMHCMMGLEDSQGLLTSAVEKALATPAPPSGGDSVSLSLGTFLPDLVVHRPGFTSLQPPQDAVGTLFELLDVDDVLMLFSAVLAEEKVLLTSSSYSALVLAAEALRQLIQPLNFNFVFIPILPRNLLDFLMAPTPFIMGVHNSYKHIVDDMDLDGVFTANLDTNTVQRPSSDTSSSVVPPLPSNEGAQLRQTLQLLLRPKLVVADLAFPPRDPVAVVLAHLANKGVSEPIVDVLRHFGDYGGHDATAGLAYSGADVANDKQLLETTIRWLFLHFFVSLFHDYGKFFVAVRVKPEPTVLFNRAAFFHARQRTTATFEHDEPFLSKLLESTAFHRFIREQVSNSHERNVFDTFVDDWQERGGAIVHPFALHAQGHLLTTEHTGGATCSSRASVGDVGGTMRGRCDVVFPDLSIGVAPPEEVRKAYEQLHPTVPSVGRAKQTLGFPSFGRHAGTADCAASQSQPLLAFFSAFEDSEEKLVQWYLHTFTEFQELLKHEAEAYSLSQRLSELVGASGRALTAMRFEILCKVVEAALNHELAPVDGPGIEVVDRVAFELLPVLTSCFVAVEGTRKYIYHQVDKATLWKNPLFWESCFYCSVQRKLMDVYNVANTSALLQRTFSRKEQPAADDSSSEAMREELVVFEQVGRFLQYQVQLGVVDNVIRQFLRKVGGECCVNRDKLDGLVATIPAQVALYNDLALAVYRKHPRVGMLPKLTGQAETSAESLDESVDVLPFLLHSELQMEAFQDILVLFPAGEHEDGRVKLARGNLYLTNYRVIFKGRYQKSAVSVPAGELQGAGMENDGDLADSVASSSDVSLSSSVLSEALPERPTALMRLRSVSDGALLRGKDRTMLADADDSSESESEGSDSEGELDAFAEADEDALQDGVTGSSDAVGDDMAADQATSSPQKGGSHNDDDAGAWIVRSVPMAAIVKINWFTIEPDQHPMAHQWGPDCLCIKTRTFQTFRITTMQGRSSILSTIQASISRLAFYHSVSDTFAIFTSLKLTVLQPQSDTLQRDKVFKSINRAIADNSLLKGANDDASFRPMQPGSALVRDVIAGNVMLDATTDMVAVCQSHCTADDNVAAVVADLARLGIESAPRRMTDPENSKPAVRWRVTTSNAEFRLCDSYPRLVCVPDNISDTELAETAISFAGSRFPCLTWVNMERGSALLRAAAVKSEGFSEGAEQRNFMASLFVQGWDTRGAASIRAKDLRRAGSLRKSRLPTRYKGPTNFLVTQQSAGNTQSDEADAPWKHVFVEADTPQLSVELGAVNNSARLLYTAVSKLEEDRLLSEIEQSGWLRQVAALLHWGTTVARMLLLPNATVVVSLDEGCDQTAQVVSLAQLLIDPYYRTLDGFRTLVKKEWLAFGHKFATRAGLRASSLAKEQAPVFLQFLDAVYQLLHQFPSSFEFTEHYLGTLAYHASSMRFGEFLHDSERERARFYREQSTRSLWAFLGHCHHRGPQFFNFAYHPTQSALSPNTNVAALRVWPYMLDGWSRDALQFDTPGNFVVKTPGVLSGFNSYVAVQIQQITDAAAEQDTESPPGWQDIWEQVAERHEPVPVSGPGDLFTPEFLPLVTQGRVQWVSGDEASKRTTHTFEARKLRGTAGVCEYCDRRIWGVSTMAFVCTICNLTVHEGCCSLVAPFCAPPSPALPAQEPATPMRKKSFLHKSRTAPDDMRSSFAQYTAGLPAKQSGGLDASLVSLAETRRDQEGAYHGKCGYMTKVGGRVHTWKKRWFFLDSVAMQLRYYRPPSNAELRGVIRLDQVSSIRAKSSYSGKTRRHSGFFIELVTPRRTFVLRAEKDEERHRWIEALQTVIDEHDAKFYGQC
eukprot:m.120153 g.120153  ORF g.120153 m.120153 type:complete len:2012 (-) comp16492_c0_seq3:54-6089(-)